MNGLGPGFLDRSETLSSSPGKKKAHENCVGRAGRIRPYNHGSLFRPHPGCLRTLALQLGPDLDRAREPPSP